MLRPFPWKFCSEIYFVPVLEISLFSLLGAVLPYSEVKPHDLIVESAFQVT